MSDSTSGQDVEPSALALTSRGASDPPPQLPPSLPAPSPSRPGVTIDHRFFPHIIDLIWFYMEYPSFVVCFNVCKAWRSQAMPRVLDHVAITERTGGDRPVIIRTRSTTWPQSSTFVQSARDLNWENLADVKQYTSHYDFIPDCSGAAHSSVLSKDYGLTDQTLLGELPRSRSYVPAGVDHFELPHVNSDILVCFLNYSDLYCFTSLSEACVGQHLVLSIDCYTNPTAPMGASRPWEFHCCPSVDDFISLTILLNNRIGSGPSPLPPPSSYSNSLKPLRVRSDACFTDTQDPEMGMVWEVLRQALFMPVISHTIYVVGLDSFLPQSEHAAYTRDLENKISAALRKGNADNYTTVDDEPFPTLTFLSHDEYREMVGDEAYNFETVR